MPVTGTHSQEAPGFTNSDHNLALWGQLRWEDTLDKPPLIEE